MRGTCLKMTYRKGIPHPPRYHSKIIILAKRLADALNTYPRWLWTGDVGLGWGELEAWAQRHRWRAGRQHSGCWIGFSNLNAERVWGRDPSVDA